MNSNKSLGQIAYEAGSDPALGVFRWDEISSSRQATLEAIAQAVADVVRQHEADKQEQALESLTADAETLGLYEARQAFASREAKKQGPVATVRYGQPAWIIPDSQYAGPLPVEGPLLYASPQADKQVPLHPTVMVDWLAAEQKAFESWLKESKSCWGDYDYELQDKRLMFEAWNARAALAAQAVPQQPKQDNLDVPDWVSGFSMAMNAAAYLEDASHCLRDADAKADAIGAAKHIRDWCNQLWAREQIIAQSRQPAPVAQEPLTREQRFSAFSRAEKRLMVSENLSWRDAIADEVEKMHGITGTKT